MSVEPVFITGPTAVGKSGVALHLAQRIDGEIISVDSMQVYRGLDLGTAKPTAAERSLLPHHLIDVVEITAPFDAAQFVRLAQEAVGEIQSRGRCPIFCGGTGLYFKAYLEGLGQSPPGDPVLRAELERTPLADLLVELQRCDPKLHATIDRRNPRRVIRAIEVMRLTGKPLSEQRARWSKPGSSASPESNRAQVGRFFALNRAREDLWQRIDRRVETMFERGLVTETEHLLASGLEQNRTAMQAIGYRQVFEHLRGERSLEETIALVKQQTRQYAKRQMTWLRHQAPVEWEQLDGDEPDQAIAARLAERIVD